MADDLRLGEWRGQRTLIFRCCRGQNNDLRCSFFIIFDIIEKMVVAFCIGEGRRRQHGDVRRRSKSSARSSSRLSSPSSPHSIFGFVAAEPLMDPGTLAGSSSFVDPRLPTRISLRGRTIAHWPARSDRAADHRLLDRTVRSELSGRRASADRGAIESICLRTSDDSQFRRLRLMQRISSHQPSCKVVAPELLRQPLDLI